MKTIATWFDRKDNNVNDDIKLDLHINFWKLSKKGHFFKGLFFSQKRYFLDFGFKIENISSIASLNIHFPFKISRNDIEDIGTKLIDNHELTKSIFNENYHIHDGNVVKQRSVQNSSNETLFNIYAIDFLENSNDISIVDVYGGTKLSIDLTSINNGNHCSKYYFRFRLKGDVLSNFKRNHEPRNWFFQSAFTETETIDFRVNEKRNYHHSLAEHIGENNEFKIQKIHFLLMRDATEDFESQHINFTCRTLEPELWMRYIGEEYNLENIIAYHWSEKVKNVEDAKPIDSFNTLVKMKYHRSNFKTICLYVAIIGFMSICFNLASSYILKGIQDEPATVENVRKDNKEHAPQKNGKKTVNKSRAMVTSPVGGE